MIIQTFEHLLSFVIRPFGLWQIIIYSQLGFVQFFFAAVNVAVIFFQIRPEYACDVYSNSSWTVNEMLQISSPLKDDSKEKDPCFYYPRNYELLSKIDNFTEAVFVAETQNDSHNVSCKKWRFNRSVDMSETIITQYGLVCDKSWYLEHSQMVYMFGMFAGSFGGGILSDKFGRKAVIVVLGIFGTIFGISESFAPNYTIFLILRFFLAFCGIGCTMGSFCLGLEITMAKYRTWVGALFFLPYAMGYAFLAPVAYWTRDWRIMHFAVAAPGIVCLVFWWTLDESPRWLLIHGRISQAESVIRKATKLNRSEVPSGTDFQQISKTMNNQEEQSKQNRVHFFHIFKLTRDEHGRQFCKYPALIGRAINLFWNWIVNAMVYYGVSLNVSSFSGDRFINNGLAGLAEIVAYIICVPLLYWGRKPALCSMLLLAGVSLFIVPWLPEKNDDEDSGDQSGNIWHTLRLVCVMLGKLAITASFNLVYTFTTELYPTVIRNSGLATSSCIGRIGSILAPYISGISKVNKKVAYVPMMIFGVCSLSAGLLTLLLPETKGRKLAEHLENAIILEEEIKVKYEEKSLPAETKI